jgi:hypothetical protein
MENGEIRTGIEHFIWNGVDVYRDWDKKTITMLGEVVHYKSSRDSQQK